MCFGAARRCTAEIALTCGQVHGCADVFKKEWRLQISELFHLGFLGHESLPAVASLLVHTPSDHLGHLLRTSTCNGRAWHVYSN